MTKLDPEDLRESRVTLRLTEREKLDWERKAKISHQNLTAWILDRVRQPIVSQSSAASADLRNLADITFMFLYFQKNAEDLSINEGEKEHFKEIYARIKEAKNMEAIKHEP